MDSITQAALGAVVGHSLMGRKIGYLAPIWGAALGTLPDLDVLIAFGGAVENFTYHRGFSHSLFVQLLATPLLVWFILKCHPDSRPFRTQWFITVIAVLWTHAFLDAFTVYGTQLLWPFTEYPFGISSVFIIDPFYTVPLLIGLLLAGIWGWTSKKAKKTAMITLCISSVYLLWSVTAKAWLHQKIEIAIAHKEIQSKEFLTTPTPLNTLLWRVLILEENTYRVGYVTLWDAPEIIKLKQYPKGEKLLEGMAENWDVKRLAWFTKGFYRVAERDQQIVVSDLRMGFENNYAFNFSIGNIQSNGAIETKRAERVKDQIDIKSLPLLWHRLWDDSVSLHPNE